MRRLWEVDFLRGVAVALMVFFNYAFALRFLGVYSLNAGWLFWFLFPRVVAGTFIFLAGVSLALSYSAAKRAKNAKSKKYILRGLKIFGYGMLVTLATWLYLKNGFVVFGILHLIGLSIILAYPFITKKYASLFLGIIFILAGIYLSSQTLSFPWLLWLGFAPAGFYSVDYFPLLPWLGVALLGLFFGNMLYPKGKRRFCMPELSEIKIIRRFCFLGRHSLIIYLLHQPLLLAALHLFVL